MVFQVRCFKCGAHEARIILGGRQILHARCQACHTNLLAEVMAFEQDAMRQQLPANRERMNTAPGSLPTISRAATAAATPEPAQAAHLDL